MTQTILDGHKDQMTKARRKFGLASIGVYSMLLEVLSEDGYYTYDLDLLAYEMRCDKCIIKSLVEDFDIFRVEGGMLYCDLLNEELQREENARKARIERARKGGLAKSASSTEKPASSTENNTSSTTEQLESELTLNTQAAENSASSTENSALSTKKSALSTTKKEKKSPTPPYKKEKPLTGSSDNFLNENSLLNKRARETFEGVYFDLYGESYYWTAKDAGQMTKLLNALKFSRKTRKIPLPIDNDSVIEALKAFLTSIDKSWIQNNFSVAMISSHYNEIVSEIKNKKTYANSKFRRESAPQEVIATDF